VSESASPYDVDYWGPGGVDIARWGLECARGIRYADKGSPAPAGTKGVERKISTGRKYRGLSSDDLARQERL
jgi:hypothetical protein